jgi:hypothetical protein
MTGTLQAQGLLLTAENLIGARTPPQSAAPWDLRRATSTAYYALFHQLTRHGVLAAIPSATEAEITYASRWFTHTGVLKAAEWTLLASKKNAVARVDREAVALLRTPAHPAPPAELGLVAETFMELQRLRHDADYNAAYIPGDKDTLENVIGAREAIKATQDMWRGRKSARHSQRHLYDSYHRFLHLALLKSGGPKLR